MTYTEYCAAINHPPGDQRRGQYAFNLLCDIRPDLSEQVRNTDLDPFYVDGKLTIFLLWVWERW